MTKPRSLNLKKCLGEARLFDLTFYAQTQNCVLEGIIALAHKDQASSVIFANAHVVVESSRQPELKKALQTATVVVADGMPVAWTLRSLGHRDAQRYSGPDLMADVFKKDPEARHFFLGSTPEVLEKIKTRFEGNAVGFYSPPFLLATEGGGTAATQPAPFTEGEIQKQIAMVEADRADYIWVGLGAPKQEFHVTQMAARARRGAWLAVGAAFDFYAETKPRAPRAFQKIGLEWAFRLACEPRRLARRYLSTNPVFVKMALGELLRRRRP